MIFEAIIFDFDGVIADSEIVANAALASVLTSLGHPTTTEEAVRLYCGLRWSDCHRRIESILERSFDAKWLEQLVDAAIEERIADVIAVEGVEPFLAAQQHRRLAIASSSDRPWLDASLARLGLAHYFGDHIFSAARLTKGKPHPDVYLRAAAMVGIDPARCLVIEDHPVGAAAGKAAGMTVIGLLAARHIGDGHGQRLRAAGAHYIASNYSEVTRIIEEIEQAKP
jgi:HAD superfamily hydrolase (TIGR01509 family)